MQTTFLSRCKSLNAETTTCFEYCVCTACAVKRLSCCVHYITEHISVTNRLASSCKDVFISLYVKDDNFLKKVTKIITSIGIATNKS